MQGFHKSKVTQHHLLKSWDTRTAKVQTHTLVMRVQELPHLIYRCTLVYIRILSGVSFGHKSREHSEDHGV